MRKIQEKDERVIEKNSQPEKYDMENLLLWVK